MPFTAFCECNSDQGLVNYRHEPSHGSREGGRLIRSGRVFWNAHGLRPKLILSRYSNKVQIPCHIFYRRRWTFESRRDYVEQNRHFAIVPGCRRRMMPFFCRKSVRSQPHPDVHLGGGTTEGMLPHYLPRSCTFFWSQSQHSFDGYYNVYCIAPTKRSNVPPLQRLRCCYCYSTSTTSVLLPRHPLYPPSTRP